MKKLTVLIGLMVLSIEAIASLKFATYNIRHFDSKNSRTNKVELKKIITKLDADFITVQEIVNTASFKTFFHKNFPEFKIVFSRCGGGGKQKIGFVYNSTKFKLTRSYEDARVSDPGTTQGEFGCGRLRPALVGFFKEIKTRKDFVIVGVHLKAGGRPSSYRMRTRQYSMLTDIVEELKRKGTKDVLIMGDFNTTGYILNDTDYHNFSDMMSDLKMKSAAEKYKCTAYWSGENRSDNIEESSVLDHILFNSSFMGRRVTRYGLYSHCKKVNCRATSAKNLGISYEEVTDHCPLAVTFN